MSPAAVDDQDVVGAVAIDVGHQRRGLRGGGEPAGVGERAPAASHEHREIDLELGWWSPG